MNKLESSKRKRIGYAISIFILGVALLIIAIPFIPSTYKFNTFTLKYIYDIISNNLINFLSIFLVEISLISVFVYMITNPKSTKKTKHKIIVVFAVLMISAYLIFAYIYHYLLNFELFEYLQFKLLNIPLSSVIYYNGYFIPAKIYVIFYAYYLPPFYYNYHKEIPNPFTGSYNVCLTTSENELIVNPHSSNVININYTVVNYSLISQESITAVHPLKIIVFAKKYLLTLKPTIKNATILNITSINSTLLNEHNASFIAFCN